MDTLKWCTLCILAFSLTMKGAADPGWSDKPSEKCSSVAGVSTQYLVNPTCKVAAYLSLLNNFPASENLNESYIQNIFSPMCTTECSSSVSSAVAQVDSACIEQNDMYIKYTTRMFPIAMRAICLKDGDLLCLASHVKKWREKNQDAPTGDSLFLYDPKNTYLCDDCLLRQYSTLNCTEMRDIRLALNTSNLMNSSQASPVTLAMTCSASGILSLDTTSNSTSYSPASVMHITLALLMLSVTFMF
jgi:hypothetical protein